MRSSMLFVPLNSFYDLLGRGHCCGKFGQRILGRLLSQASQLTYQKQSGDGDQGKFSREDGSSVGSG